MFSTLFGQTFEPVQTSTNRLKYVETKFLQEYLIKSIQSTAIKMVSVLQSIDSGHEDLIHGAVLDYYGLNLATCSSDNCVKVNFTNFYIFSSLKR